MDYLNDRKVEVLKSKLKELEENRIIEECLNSFERFLNFVVIKDKNTNKNINVKEEIIKYKEYLDKIKVGNNQ